MRSILYVFTGLLVMALAVWAYRQNYETQASLREVSDIRTEIALLRERAGVLRAEWAYLNRPERLTDLADMNFVRLGLLPLRPDHFGHIDEITYPVEPLPPIFVPIEVMSRLENSK
ncbi:MAG: cell division protein FtsL [Boseongicola sp.]|nr:cell division protein FtsL [Boseongicola sp.]MDD9976150.1 cell division protein FtsL [Boseongicola sp.]